MLLRLAPLLGLLALAACGGGGGNPTTTATTTTAATTATATTATAKSAGGCTTVAKPAGSTRTKPKPSAPLDPKKTYEVTFQTNCGSFTIQLDPAQSPNATASFASLVEKGYFDHTIFHRVVPGFVIQGGDPTGTGTGGPGYTTVDTPPPGATYKHGVVAMAKTATEAAGTAGSQFFVVTAPDAGLPPDYAIIGTVTKGLDVVDRIGKLGDPNSEQPTRVIEIQKATVSSS